MAQANCLTSAIGMPVTGASTKQFTSPFRAVQVQMLPVLVKHHYSRWLLPVRDAVGSDDRVDQSRGLFAAQLSAIMIADDFTRVS
jgi:hypothetical protein